MKKEIVALQYKNFAFLFALTVESKSCGKCSDTPGCHECDDRIRMHCNDGLFKPPPNVLECYVGTETTAERNYEKKHCPSAKDKCVKEVKYSSDGESILI